MVVGARVCELTDGFLWFVYGNLMSPLKSSSAIFVKKRQIEMRL